MEPKKNIQQESLFQRIRHSISDFSPSQARIFGVPSPIYRRNTVFDFKKDEEIDHLNLDSIKSPDTRPEEFSFQHSASELAHRSRMLRRSFPLNQKHLSLPDGMSRSNSTTKLLKPHDQNVPKRPISPMQATIMIQSDF